MFWKLKPAASNLPGDPCVTAIDTPAQKPSAAMERWIQAVVQAHGALPLSDLIGRVADRLYRDALGHSAACVDIGLFGAKLFISEATAHVASGDGRWWAIGKKPDRLAFAAGRQCDDFADNSGQAS